MAETPADGPAASGAHDGGSATTPSAAELRRIALQRRRGEDPLYYNDYLRVGDLLTLQQPKTREAGAEAHDEHLFIVVHQVYELWFKQILHEVDSVRAIFSRNPVDERDVGTAVARLARIREIQTLLLQQITVLETMSPIDFLDFRDYLYPASGFQSVQFRLIENKLGLPPSQRLPYGTRGYCTYLHGGDSETVKAAEAAPSLFGLVEAWLERTPFLEMDMGGEGEAAGAAAGEAAPVVLAPPTSDGADAAPAGAAGGFASSASSFSWWDHYRDAVETTLAADERAFLDNPRLEPGAREAAEKECATTRAHFASLLDRDAYEASRKRGERRLSYRAMQAALLITLYQHEPILQLPYRLLQLLQDIDEQFTAWRARHAQMVHRMLGIKMGTGGSSGYHYLRATVERHKVFADLANLSTFLIPRYMMPPIPKALVAKLAFAFSPSSATARVQVPVRGAGGEAAAAAAGGGAAATAGLAASGPTIAEANAGLPASAIAAARGAAAGDGGDSAPARCPFGHS